MAKKENISSSYRSPALTDLRRDSIVLMTRDEQRTLDKAWTEKTGLSLSVLMEQAAFAVTSAVLDLIRSVPAADLPKSREAIICRPEAEQEEFRLFSKSEILILAGAGQNGGDAWASARQLMAYGCKVTVVDFHYGEKLPAESEANRSAYRQLDGLVISPENLSEHVLIAPPEYIIDGIFGSGFQTDRALSSDLNEIFSLINELAGTTRAVIAIDVPSGVDCDTGAAVKEAIKADYTVSFGRAKAGLFSEPGCLFAGQIITAPISMPDLWQDKNLESKNSMSANRTIHLAVTSEWLKTRKIIRREDGNKGDFGRGLILGGFRDMPGAVILAARAMMQAGCGYTYVRTSQDILPLLADALPSALIAELKEDSELSELIAQVRAVAAGPGAGQPPWMKILPSLISNASQLVVDADALNYLAERENWSDITLKRAQSGLSPAVLTPHPGEFKRLAPDLSDLLSRDRAGAALKLAQRSGSIIVLKGHATVTALPSGVCFYNTSGNQGLSKAGSGDVLTGLMASLLAQGYTPETAAPAAVFLHGLAADLALADLKNVRSVTPEIILSYLALSFQYAGW